MVERQIVVLFVVGSIPTSHPKLPSVTAVWCNGSTRDSGSLSLGSSPGTATQAAIELNRLQLFCYSMALYYNELRTFGCPF